MSMQRQLPGLDAGKIDISRLVKYEPMPNGGVVRVLGVGRRSSEIGQCIGIISLKHASGYEVVVRFDDGKIETFSPMGLAPAPSALKVAA